MCVFDRYATLLDCDIVHDTALEGLLRVSQSAGRHPEVLFWVHTEGRDWQDVLSNATDIKQSIPIQHQVAIGN